MGQPLPDAAGLGHVAPLVGDGVGERHSQTHFEESGNRAGHFDAAEVQAIGALQLADELALHVMEGRQHAGDRLAVQWLEALGRGNRMPDRRRGFAQEVPFERRILEGSGGGEPAGTALLDRFLNGVYRPMSDHGQMGEALFDTPLVGRRAPIELDFAQAAGEFVGLGGNALKRMAVLFEFLKHYQELYSTPKEAERAPAPWRRPMCRSGPAPLQAYMLPAPLTGAVCALPARNA